MGIKFSQLPIASSVASDDYIAVLDSSESVLKRTPINHASQGSAYGLGTTTEYGHNKIIDNLSQNTLVSGESLSARQGNVIANDMGQVELSTTAAYAHNQGDYFILIGQFVKCIQAISVGDTINLGTNVEATNIGAVLGQLNSKIGDTAIPSRLGTTITGAIYNNSKGYVYATISKSNYTTNAAMLSALYERYLELEAEARFKAHIARNNILYNLVDRTNAIFSACVENYTVNPYSLRLNTILLSEYKISYMDSTDNFSRQDISSSAPSFDMYLVLI